MKYSQSAEDKRRKKNFRFCTKENNSGRSQRGEGEEGVCIKQLWCCLLCSTKKKQNSLKFIVIILVPYTLILISPTRNIGIFRRSL